MPVLLASHLRKAPDEVVFPGEGPIVRLHAPAVSTFRSEFERPRNPLVVSGALDGWPALERWSFERLSSAHGDVRVNVRTSPRGKPQLFAGDPRAAFQFESLRLEQALEEIQSPRERILYVQYCELARDLPRLAGDIADLAYPRGLLCSPALLWICGREAVNPLHWDYNHVVLAQVRGEKTLVLFPPDDSPRLASWTEREVWRTSSLDLSAERARAALAGVSPRVCTLKPGEFLFIPYRWWHYAECHEDSISVSWWWEPSIAIHVRDVARERVAAVVKRGLRRFDG